MISAEAAAERLPALCNSSAIFGPSQEAEPPCHSYGIRRLAAAAAAMIKSGPAGQFSGEFQIKTTAVPPTSRLKTPAAPPPLRQTPRRPGRRRGRSLQRAARGASSCPGASRRPSRLWCAGHPSRAPAGRTARTQGGSQASG